MQTRLKNRKNLNSCCNEQNVGAIAHCRRRRRSASGCGSAAGRTTEGKLPRQPRWTSPGRNRRKSNVHPGPRLSCAVELQQKQSHTGCHGAALGSPGCRGTVHSPVHRLLLHPAMLHTSSKPLREVPRDDGSTHQWRRAGTHAAPPPSAWVERTSRGQLRRSLRVTLRAAWPLCLPVPSALTAESHGDERQAEATMALGACSGSNTNTQAQRGEGPQQAAAPVVRAALLSALSTPAPYLHQHVPHAARPCACFLPITAYHCLSLPPRNPRRRPHSASARCSSYYVRLGSRLVVFEADGGRGGAREEPQPGPSLGAKPWRHSTTTVESVPASAPPARKASRTLHPCITTT